MQKFTPHTAIAHRTKIGMWIGGRKVIIRPQIPAAWVDGKRMRMLERGGIASNTCRRVLVGSGLVVKLDVQTGPGSERAWVWDQCRREGSRWDWLKRDHPALAQFFAPVLAYGEGWEVQEYVPHSKSGDHNQQELLWEIQRQVGNLTDVGLSVLGGHNVGIHEDTGRLVIFDYAGGVE